MKRRSTSFTLWLSFLLVLIALGGISYARQLHDGLQLTGLNQHASWGLYIGAFTFLVGIAASAVVLSLSALCTVTALARLTLFGEALAIASVCAAIACVIVDLGRPQNLIHLFFPLSWRSPMMWDFMALGTYLAVNCLLFVTGLRHERTATPIPFWARWLCLASIPLALSIHIITAFLYAGLPARAYWFSALLGARFLASAFCAGPALLLLGLYLMRHVTGRTVDKVTEKALRLWILFALAAHCLFFGLELFTTFYSGIPALQRPLSLLLSSPITWMGLGMALSGALLLFSKRKALTGLALLLVIGAMWLDKGVELMRGGFNPNPFAGVTIYAPTLTEYSIVCGIFAMGLLILSLLWRMIVELRKNL